jgi:hypothetical protein
MLVVAMFVAGCSGGGSLTPPTSTSGQAATTLVAPEPTASIEVTITPVAKVRNGIVYVTGTTDLVDGALLNWEVGRWSKGSGEPFKSGKVTVTNGTFTYRVKVSSIPGNQLYAFTVFGSGGQPQSVRDAYGEYGQNIGGPGVYSQGKYRMLETWVIVNR